VRVKEFLKSVNIWRRYGQKYGGMFFLTHSVLVRRAVISVSRC